MLLESVPEGIRERIQEAVDEDQWDKLIDFMESSDEAFRSVVYYIYMFTLEDPLLNVLIHYKKTDLALNVINVIHNKDHLLEMKNFKGDTALHVAVSMHNITVSRVILDNNPRLMFFTNCIQETPLHKAALNGHKDIFWELVLHGSNVHARRNDGSTILHCAVIESHFGLALEIAQGYPDLIEMRDELGLTILHHMVTMTKVFGAEAKLSPLKVFLYRNMEEDTLYGNRTTNIGDEENCLTDDDGFPMGSIQGVFGRSDLIESYEQYMRTNVEDLSSFINTTAASSGKFNLLTSYLAEKAGQLMTKTLLKLLDEQKLIELKRQHRNACELLVFAANKSGYWTSLGSGRERNNLQGHSKESNHVAERWMETPLTLAAKMGLDRLVVGILRGHPKAAKYLGNDGKNVLHVAVQHRRQDILKTIESKDFKDPRVETWLTSGIDYSGNTILHLAARPINKTSSRPMQMVDEFEWFERVMKLLPGALLHHRNNEGKTAEELFSESHNQMVEDGKRQLTNTARSCCAALVSAITFAAGFSIVSDPERKVKNSYDKLAFKIFSHAYLVGLSCGAMALAQFMALLASNYTEQDFRLYLPTQYFLSNLSLFLAMLSVLVAFACNTYIKIYGGTQPRWENAIPITFEILSFPAFCLLVLLYKGVFRFPLASILPSFMGKRVKVLLGFSNI